MNEQYWDNFYEKFDEKEPSNFAKFVADKFVGKDIIDVGCGNKRDSNYFEKLGYNVVGIDKIYGDDATGVVGHFDNVYMRWFIHSIPEDAEDIILNNIKGDMLFIEARSVNDTPDDTHYRRLIDCEKLLDKLADNGYEILYCDEGKGMSVYKGDDPCLIRVVATLLS